ncbi:YEATS domain-containing protein 2 [Asbolus verrucosus]|uniref:YEATS domain-containing protein 2 n=1 Tax=Asbolus verrucosus TaxID=1661398 RepID=A0A482W2W2_ASBVE|nr:YEATS domain-containing protein 2 [Asbolus verrucosus]
MDHYRESGKVDPDYESYNSALELNEEEDKKENLLKLKRIIEEEYNKEIIQRQDQIEQIELQICKVRKLLHLLRYALIMSYYKKKELEYSGTEDEASTSDSFNAPDKQSRIHPAVKKLLGKNIHNLDHLNIKDKRKSHVRSNLNSSHKAPEVISNLPESKRIKLDLEISQPSEKITSYDTPNSSIQPQETNLEFIRNRKKTKYRIVVGNISKWMPSSEDDILTHKWMVYVRGPKEKPDVSHFIEKVIFYLHPSYKPHDVVEVSESPFHLSRRGWGEFPVRVQIFFKVTLNKPIDVIHNIKLDKTYSGRQTLGNETIIDVFLYDNNIEHISNQEPELINQLISQNHNNLIEIEDTKVEEQILTEDLQNVASTSAEHDYCFGQLKIEKEENGIKNDDLSFDHSYCLPSMDENSSKISRDLITLTNKSEQNNFKVTLPKNKFKNMGEALPYLFKRLPLYSELANNVNYKRLYPFTASTLKEFVSWNVGKRRSSEVCCYAKSNIVYYIWNRAKTIKIILFSEKIQGAESWSTKAILMYGRSHDYTPFISYGLFHRDSEEKNLLLSCFANSSQNMTRNSLKISSHEDSDITVNVDSDIDVTSPKQCHGPTVDISDPNLKLECSYIRQTALDCGIILKPEEIEDGVKVNGAEIMIFAAVKCLAENLIRRAKNHRSQHECY